MINFAFVYNYQDKLEPHEGFSLTVKPSFSINEILRRFFLSIEAPKGFVEHLVNSVLIYDQTILEWNATPAAVDMSDGDLVLVLDKSYFNKEKFKCLSAKEVDIIRHFFKISMKKIVKSPNFLPLIPMLTECKMGHPNPGDQATC